MRSGKTWKDLEKKGTKAVKDPRPVEKGGMRNLIREALEEMEPLEEQDEDRHEEA